MTEFMQNTTCFIWIGLAILVWARLKQWDERFRELYDKTKRLYDKTERNIREDDKS